MDLKKVEDAESFHSEVQDKDKIFIKFEADWCGPCHAMQPIVEEVAKTHKDVKFLAVDIMGDGMYEIASEYGVRSVPTYVKIDKEKDTYQVETGTLSRQELSDFVQR